jgi:TIR domain
VRELSRGIIVASLFFSYSHVDEELRDQLEKHLAALQRQGLISSWHDRRITAGTNIGRAIDSHIDAADIVLLLVSPDFIASDYCYEREMERALERHHKGQARVIPVILRPCDWHDLPFGELLAAPKDGRPITKWSNVDEAFLDVVHSIKRALTELGQKTMAKHRRTQEDAGDVSVTRPSEQTRSSNLRIKKRFTDLDKDRFRHEGFEYMAKFFENSLQELTKRNPGLDHNFRRIDANTFTAAAYMDGEKVCRCSVSLSGRTMGSDAIEYSMSDEGLSHGMNEALYVKADDQMLYFEVLGMQSYGPEKQKLTFQGAAEVFWDLFVRPLQPR